MTLKQKNLLVAGIIAGIVALLYVTSLTNELFMYENYKGMGGLEK